MPSTYIAWFINISDNLLDNFYRSRVLNRRLLKTSNNSKQDTIDNQNSVFKRVCSESLLTFEKQMTSDAQN